MRRRSITTTSSRIGPTSPTARTSSTSDCCRWKSAALWNRTGASQHNVGTPTTIRLGLTEWIEARISSDGFLSVDRSARARSAASATSRSARSCGSGPIPAACRCCRFCRPSTCRRRARARGSDRVRRTYTIAALTGIDFLTRGHIDVNYGIGTNRRRHRPAAVHAAPAVVVGERRGARAGDAVSRRLLDFAAGSGRRHRRRHRCRRHLRDQPAARPRRRRAVRPDRMPRRHCRPSAGCRSWSATSSAITACTRASARPPDAAPRGRGRR